MSSQLKCEAITEGQYPNERVRGLTCLLQPEKAAANRSRSSFF